MFRDFVELYILITEIFFNGGWILFVLALVYMFFRLYMDHINYRWYLEQEWVFLKISVPPENEKSPITFEQIFNQLHAIQNSRTWAEKYLEGQFQIWFTWELVSIGGIIGNYVRVLTKHRDVLEASIYAQYPDAEISEAEDYFDRLPKTYDPDAGFDVFPFSIILKKEDAYPIRSYLDFEHASMKTFIDPVTGLWEELGKISEYEMYVVQYLFQPATDDWKDAGYKLVKKMKGEEENGGIAFIGPFIDFLREVLVGLLDAFTPTGSTDDKKKQTENRLQLGGQFLLLTEGERNVISAIERNLSKLGYATKIRCMYLAPKEKFNPGPVNSAAIGAYKALGATDLNSLKPDTGRWPRVGYWLFKNLEKPIVDLRIAWRKRNLYNMVVRRNFFSGPSAFHLNTEEIATILHFPSTEVIVPRIDKVPVVKEQPPPDLPIA